MLVVDRSGSMQGTPLNNAKKGLIDFISDMQINDKAALVLFENHVTVVQDFTNNKKQLTTAVKQIQVGGATRLYDAIAKAAGLLTQSSGTRVIVFLTDGRDNRSSFTLENIRNMNLGEGIFVYGLGLGDVNESGLQVLSDVTGGIYRGTQRPSDLVNLYSQASSHYYSLFRDKLSTSGGYVVSSLPSKRMVLIDSKRMGFTPLKIDGIPEGMHNIQVVFDRGAWECRGESLIGYRNLINARESELGYDFYIASEPAGASVFLDDSYVGMTSAKIPKQKKVWFRKKKDFSNQLKVPLVPIGKHHIRIIALPDIDFGGEQTMEFDFVINNEERFVEVDVFGGKAVFQDGEEITREKIDPFQELDSKFPEDW